MYEDTPMFKIGDVFEEIIFKGSSLGRDIAGSEKTVKAVQRDDFERYRNIHYYPENMLITVAGKISDKEVVKIAEEYLGSLKPRSKSEPKFKLFRGKQTRPQVKLHPKKKEQAHFILGFRSEGRGYKGRYAEAVLSTILGGGMSSRLFSEVRERRGLAYSVRSLIEKFDEIGYLGTYAGVDVKRVDEAIKVVLDQHYGLAELRFPISEREMTKAKEYLKGHIALSLEDTKEINDFFAQQELFLPQVKTPEEVYKAVDKVTIDEVIAEAKKRFRPEGLNLGIIGPYDDKARFEKLLS
jgi:predicted Zn-dependent peptidase